jgi:hypothetical protein
MTGSPVDRYDNHAAARFPYQRVTWFRRRIYYVRDSRISGTVKGEIASGKPGNGDIM